MSELAELDALIAEIEQARAGARDWRNQQPPKGMVFDPVSQQYTNREMIKRNLPEPTGGQAALMGAAQSAVMNYGDEIAGARGDINRETVRAKDELAQERTIPYTTGQIAGAIPAALGTAPLAAAKTGMGIVGRSAALGGAEAGLWASGQGESSIADRVRTALPAAAMGGVLGGAIPVVAGAVRRGVRGVGAIKDAIKDTPSTKRASRDVAATLRRSGKSTDEIAEALMRAAQEGQPEYRVIDTLGQAGRERIRGLVRGGGEATDEIREFLEGRQMDQRGRLSRFVGDAFEMKGETAESEIARRKAVRGAAADVNYLDARARANPVDVRSAVSVIDDRIGGMQGSGVSGDSVDSILAKYRNRLVAPDGKTPDGVDSVELSDFDRVLGVKQDLQDEIGTLARAGKNNAVRELKKLERAIDDALEASNTSYRAANDEFRDATRAIEAVEAGQQLARPTVRGADVERRFATLSPEEQAAARVGAGDTYQKQIGNIRGWSTNAANQVSAPETAQSINAMAVDAPLFNRRVGRERDMFETVNAASFGSRTADNLAAMEADQAGTMAARVVRNPQGEVSLGAMAGNAIDWANRIASGQNDATRKLIAQILVSGNTKLLNDALRQDLIGEGQRRIVEALLRGGGSRGVGEALPAR